MERFFRVSGLMDRKTFAICLAVFALVMFCAGIVLSGRSDLSSAQREEMISISSFIGALLLIVPAIRRMRHMGARPWYLLGLLVPIVQFGVIGALLFAPGWLQAKPHLRALLRALHVVAVADGPVNSFERAFIAAAAHEALTMPKWLCSAVSDEWAIDGFDAGSDLEGYIRDFMKAQKSITKDSKEQIFALFVGLSRADGPEPDADELKVLERCHTALGLRVALAPDVMELISMAAKLAKADGVVSPVAIEVMEEFFRDSLDLTGPSRTEAVRIFQEAKTSNSSLDDHAARFLEHVGTDEHRRTVALGLLARIGMPDGKQPSSAVIQMLDRIGILFGVSSSQSDGGSGTPYPGDEFAAHLAVLGLSPEATAADLKNAYRRLIRENHPDRVPGTSKAIRDVAEAETKKINAAYAFLEQRLH